MEDCWIASMGLLPNMQNWGLRMRRGCRERFPRSQLPSKHLTSDPGMHHGTCVTHVLWSMSGSLTRGGGKNVPGIPDACATRNLAYLVRGPLSKLPHYSEDKPAFIFSTAEAKLVRRIHPIIIGIEKLYLSKINHTSSAKGRNSH